MSGEKFMLNWVEHEKKFYNLGALLQSVANNWGRGSGSILNTHKFTGLQGNMYFK